MENVTIVADQFTYSTAEYLNDPVDLFPFRLRLLLPDYMNARCSLSFLGVFFFFF